MNIHAIFAIIGSIRRDAMDDTAKAFRECGAICSFLEKSWPILSHETRKALMERLEKLLEYAQSGQNYVSPF